MPLTVTVPSLISHSSAPFQADISLPSKRMMASDGGLPSVPAVTSFCSGQILPEVHSLAINTRPPEINVRIATDAMRTLPVETKRCDMGACSHRAMKDGEPPYLS